MKRTLLPLALLTGLASAPLLRGAIVVNDTFTDGGFTNGADTDDVAWFGYYTGSGPTLGIASDTTLGGGNALNVSQSTLTFKGVASNFANQTLNVGDSLSLDFDFRFTATPANNSGGLRLALGNQSTLGSAATGTGYFVTIGTGTGTGLGISKDLGGAADSITSGPTTALTLTQTGTPSPLAIADTAGHNLGFTVTRTASGYDMSFVLDNGTAYTASDDGSGIDSPFNLIALVEGGISTAYRIDNVALTYTAVPEPSTYGLSGAGALAAVAFVRRRRKRS